VNTSKSMFGTNNPPAGCKPAGGSGRRPLPPGWRWVRLGEVGTFSQGGTPRKSVSKYWGGDIPFVTGADVTSEYVSNGRAFLTKEGLHSGQTCICQPGTLLFVTRTRVGRFGIATRVMGASQDISPYVCKELLLPEYAYWYLTSISESIRQATQGSTILGLTREYVENIPLPLPPLLEQRAIVARLEAQMAQVQRLRAAAERQLEAIHALPGALLNEAFGGFAGGGAGD